jgi:CheY-like chemotaxis protein
MLPSGTCARSTASYDWPAGGLGAPEGWPLSLRLAADIVLNCPLPMLLAWGPQRAVVFNDAYAALAGPGYGRAPGGSVPLVLPPPLGAGHDAFERAWRGEAALQPAARLSFARAGGGGEYLCDLYFTPLQRAPGAVGGVLCALAPAAASASAGGVQADAATHDAARQHGAAQRGAVSERGGALRILVVEDDLDSQYLVCEMLKAFGHEPDGVAHPDDALAHLAAARYDVLFTDVSLPGMSGLDLARRARDDAPAMKVIFASGYGDTLLRHLEFPYVSLQKPYELDQLQQALATVGGGSHGPA